MSNEINSDYITANQLAAMIGMSLKFVKKHMTTRRLPGITHMGKSIRFSVNEVKQQLATGRLLLSPEESLRYFA